MNVSMAEPGKASLPWRLLAVSGLLGLALAALGPDPGLHPTTSGRAQLNSVIDPGDPGWQIQLDPRALGLSHGQIQGTLTDLLGGGASLAGLPGDHLVTLTRLDSAGRVTVAASEEARKPSVVDPLFGGTPSAVFEWTRGAYTVRGNLFAKSGTSGVLSGRLVGSLPFSGLQGAGDGFTWDSLGLMPPDFERLVAIDPTILRFQSTYREPIQRQWDRWEFFPLATLGKAIGPALVYAHWRGQALFSIGVRDVATVRAAIDKRFPAPLIRTGARWSYGTRLRGFEPDGPAWLLRGDSLLATRTGGTKRLEAALVGALSKQRSFESKARFMDEIQRLASVEAGWHVVLILRDPSSALDWAALIRWPDVSGSRVTGYIVVQPKEPIANGAPSTRP
jgi:hypothetical protein